MRPRLSPLTFLLVTFQSIPVVHAENPIIQTKYTADPAPLVYKDVVYLYTSHDEDTAVSFSMFNWLLYTTTDMVNFTDRGIVAGVKAPVNTFPWAAGHSAWAPQVIERDGKFFMYAPINGKGKMTIAVAVADSPLGPFKDPLGKSLADTGTIEDIDPSVFIDGDGQAYLYWGNPNVYYVKLNRDMISTSGSITKLPKIQTYQEGPWAYRRGDHYYLAFASTCCPEGIGYAMSTSPTGPWTYKNSIMDGDQRSSGNHPGIIDYKGNTYVFGFNYNIQLQREGKRLGERRSVCVEKIAYKADGTLPKLPFWSTTGPEQIEHLNPYKRTEAETIAWAWDVRTETCDEGGMNVTDIQNGDYINVKGVDFGEGATSLDVRIASAGSGGSIEVRLGSKTGTLVGTCAVSGTGGAQTWTTKTCAITGASGVHDLVFVFTGSGTGSLFNFDWWKFSGMPSNGGVGGQGGEGGTVAGATGTGGAGGGSTSTVTETGASGGLSVGGRSAHTSASVGSSSGSVTGGASSGTGSSGSGGTGGGMSSAQSSSASPGGNTRSSGGASGGASASTGASKTATEDSSGCSCSLGRSSAGQSKMLRIALVVGLVLLRRRRFNRVSPILQPAQHVTRRCLTFLGCKNSFQTAYPARDSYPSSY